MCRFIEQNLEEPLTLAKLGEKFGHSPFHLQKMFKAVLKITPREYADSCRMSSFKRNLNAGQSVTRALYEAGYGSSSRLYERASKHLGMTPDKYRRGAIAVSIRYTSVPSPLGRMLVAATDKGICAIRFGGSDAELEQGLRREYPFAARRREDDGLKTWTEQLLQCLDGNPLDRSLPLDIRSTAFQRKVWSHLQQIPRGTTESYGEVARKIGAPSAARAVARACATNPVAVAIPCHRVVRENGDLGGYRWGSKRKEALLSMESGSTA
jgi:AraC family transcriptional regulator of adaptative response/methylated-DNA-[protein]-cysteine methyltransferase